MTSRPARPSSTINCASCRFRGGGHPVAAAAAAPNLAELAPTLDTQTILTQIENGGGPMPAGLVSGADADNVAPRTSSRSGE